MERTTYPDLTSSRASQPCENLVPQLPCEMTIRGCLRNGGAGAASRAIGIERNGGRGENHSIFASSAALNHNSVVTLRPVAMFASSSVAVPTRSPAASIDAVLINRSAASNGASADDKVFMSRLFQMRSAFRPLWRLWLTDYIVRMKGALD